MSDTPRTSEEWKRLQRDETGRYSSKVKYGDLAHGMSDFAKHLERELAEVTKQRDELAEACKKLMKVIGSPDDPPEEWWATEDEINEAWHAGNEALSAVNESNT